MTFGVLLTGLTLAGAAEGWRVIGFYDVKIGGMFVAFGLRAVTFGQAVVQGRVTVTGRTIPPIGQPVTTIILHTGECLAVDKQICS